MKPDALYIRTSPALLDDQRERLLKSLGKSIRGRLWYEDTGCSPQADRPAWQSLVRDINSDQIGRLYFCNLQVLGFRNLDELADFLLLCEDHGVEWKGPEPTFRSAARAARAFLRERISARAREGLARRKAAGKPQGGDRRSGTRDIPASSVRKILELHEQGVSDSEIARRLGHHRHTIRSVRRRGE